MNPVLWVLIGAGLWRKPWGATEMFGIGAIYRKDRFGALLSGRMSPESSQIAGEKNVRGLWNRPVGEEFAIPVLQLALAKFGPTRFGFEAESFS